jgi:hypothetical protein
MKQNTRKNQENKLSISLGNVSRRINVNLLHPFLMICLFTLSFTAYSQTVSYKVSESSTEYHRVQAWLTPFYADANLVNINMGWGVGAKVSVLKNLQFTGSFLKASEGFDMEYRSAAVFIPVHNVDYQEFHKVKNIDLGVNLVFSDKEKQKPMRVNLRKSSNTTTFIEPVLTVRKLRYLRGGINFFNTTLSSEILSDENIVTDEYTFGTYGVYDVDYNEIFSTDGLHWAVPMNTMTLSVGLGSDLFVNSTVEVSGYGTKYAKRTVSQYLDFLFAPVVNIEELMFHEESIDVTGDGEGVFTKSRFGVRYGIEYLFIRRLFSMGAGMDMGWRPGLAGKGFFLNGKVYFPLINVMKR